MSYHASAFDDMAGSLRADASFEINTAHIFSSSFKASSLNGSGTTPRLLFTWNPYSSGGPAETLRQPEADATPLQQPQRAGEEATSPMLSTRQQGSEAGGEEAASPLAAAATGARPPLTISTLLQEMSGSGAGSPQLSASAAAALLTPHHQPLQQQHHSPADGASVHSTPSGAVLKRIPTSAKDGRQYFLDYSPPGAANNAPVVGGTMPSLMLPPNLSPKSRGVSPVLSSLPMPSQAQQVRRLPADTDGMDGEGRTSTATSPQVAPLMSPPRSSSIGGSGVLSVGPAFPPASLSQHHSGVYGIYGTSPQQRGQSSSLLGNSLNGAGLLAAATGGSPGVTQHNPYRTSPTFSPVQPGGVAQQQPALAHQPATRHLHINPAVATTTAARPVENTDADAELFEALEASPSTFIKRLLPPPPPLPEVARVLPMRGVVQTLCERWCSMVEAVLRAREFDNVTTPPPPPPPIPSPTDTAVPPRPVEDAEGKPAAASCPPAVVEELKTWYEAAAAWYEQLDQAGAASVDIRASSRTVAWAVDVVASGRGRRGGSGSGQHNTNGGSRYSNGGGRAAAGYRGGAGGGGGGYGYSGAGAYGTRGFGGYRGGRGGGTPVSAAAAAAAPFYPASLSSANAIHGGGGSELEAMTNNSTNNSRNAYYGSTFNPYAESWKFSGDAQLPPPPPMQAKGPYSGKMTATGPQGYAAHPTLNQM